MDALNNRMSKERAYTTYMTIMARPHKNGVLIRHRAGKTAGLDPAPASGAAALGA